MQPIDFLRFFEEFRVRVPDVATHEVTARRVVPRSRRTTEKRTEPISPRRRLLLSFDELNNERTSVEERLARIVASGDTKQSTQIRKRLDRIQNKRLEVLVQLEKVAGEKVSVFVSYSHKDQRFRSALEKQLAILKRQNLIEVWHDREITAGSDWKGEISDHLDSADLILLLISPDFVASDYCYDVEMKRALKRHRANQAQVIPIILRPVMWLNAPFARLQALPTEGKPITKWGDRDTAFLDVAEGIRAAIKSMATKSQSKRG